MIPEAFLEPISEALLTCLRMGPILFVVLIATEVINHYYSERLKEFSHKSRLVMPGISAGLCLIPGCSFGIFFATLFTSGLARVGTLMAALLATSDEALYVFIPMGINPVPILATKFGIALVAGLGTELLMPHKWMIDEHGHGEEFCCRHHHHSKSKLEMAKHAGWHTLRILLVVLVTLSIINIWVDTGGDSVLKHALDQAKFLQPLLAAIVGAVPSCSTSVILATLYGKGVITLGAAIAGLCAASGEAILVLAAKGANYKQITAVLLLLLGISTAAGYLIDFLGFHL